MKDKRTSHLIINRINHSLMILEQKVVALRSLGLHSTAELFEDCIDDIRRDLRVLESRITKTTLRNK